LPKKGCGNILFGDARNIEMGYLGDAPSCPRLWRDHDQEWELLQVHELWKHEWVQLTT